MMQIITQTHEEKVAMYKKLSKKELIEMLIAANNALQNQAPIIVYPQPGPVINPFVPPYPGPNQPYYYEMPVITSTN